MEFYHSALLLRAELTTFLMNEKHVPKKWRFVFSFPMLDIMKDMFGHIIAANDIFPYTQEAVAERKALQRYAIDDCERMWDMLQYMLCTLFRDTSADHPIPAQLELIGEILDRTESLFKAWRKSTKLLSNKSEK